MEKVQTEKQILKLTAVLIHDDDEEGFTGFFEEHPQAVAEGDTEDELLKNLFKAFNVLGKMNREDIENSFMAKVQNHGHVTRRHLELELA